MAGIYERLCGAGASDAARGEPILHVVAVAPAAGLRLALPLPVGWCVAPRATSPAWPAFQPTDPTGFALARTLLGPARLRVCLEVCVGSSAGDSVGCPSFRARTVSRGAITGPGEAAFYTLAALPAPPWQSGRRGLLTVDWQCPATRMSLSLSFRGGQPKDLKPLLRCLPYLRCQLRLRRRRSGCPLGRSRP
ncbi:MAG: hypothetical protein ACYC5Y_11775 [Symbiobacteriia bacterium]